MIEVVKSALDKDFCGYLSLSMDMMMDFLGNPKDPGNISNSNGYYSPVCFEPLLLHLQSMVEDSVEKRLYPCYSYGRIYRYGSILPKHKDRPPGEYGVTICIDKDTPWDINFEVNGETLSYDLDPGDLCIYRGMDYLHWRDKYAGQKQTQCFLMYVDADGPYSEWKYDKRSALCMPGR